VESTLHGAIRAALARHTIRCDGAWLHAEIEGQAVLAHMDQGDTSGRFFAEHDPEAVLAWLRRELWAGVGQRATVVPVGRWSDCMDLRESTPGDAHDSQRAREVWERIAPMVRAGKVRSVLLDGPPRTGKSTIARRLILNAEEALGRPLSVLRICVADFDYLRTSSIYGAVAFLQPDVVMIDDLDRFGNSSSLLDLFEHMRAHVRLVIATSNDPTKLPLALRLPGRLDEVLEVTGAGPDLAAHVLGVIWCRLTEPQREVVAGWPVALIEELSVRLTHRPGASPADEVASLEKRAQEGRGEKKGDENKTAVVIVDATAA
jgi:hypothetical protein